MELIVVLTNLASGRCRGESCARPGAASRVAALELLFGRRPYAVEGSADGRAEAAQQRAWRRPVVLGSHNAGDDAAVPAMVAQWRGWQRRAGGDWGDPPCRPYVTVSSPAGAE
jgi:hypothetical protein